MHIAIVEILEKKGSSTDTELLKELQKLYGEVSYRELNNNLLRLEVKGIIRVSRMTKGKFHIELVKKVR